MVIAEKTKENPSQFKKEKKFPFPIFGFSVKTHLKETPDSFVFSAFTFHMKISLVSPSVLSQILNKHYFVVL